jgi:hypothetical protein
VVRMGRREVSSYKISVEKSKSPLGRPKHRWETMKKAQMVPAHMQVVN